LRDGGFLVLGKVSDDKALVQSPLSPKPELMGREEFEAVWNGEIVLMARRAGLARALGHRRGDHRVGGWRTDVAW